MLHFEVKTRDVFIYQQGSPLSFCTDSNVNFKLPFVEFDEVKTKRGEFSGTFCD